MPRAQTSADGSPRTVALVFTPRWLACTYHQKSCVRIPGALSAYADALRGAQEQSFATPAERTAHFTVRGATAVRTCRDQAVVTISYTAGSTPAYQLHVNLVLRQVGWRVFDLAEAPPHIPPPSPIADGPRECGDGVAR